MDINHDLIISKQSKSQWVFSDRDAVQGKEFHKECWNTTTGNIWFSQAFTKDFEAFLGVKRALEHSTSIYKKKTLSCWADP